MKNVLGYEVSAHKLKLNIIYKQSFFDKDTADGALLALLTTSAEMKIDKSVNDHKQRKEPDI